MKRLNIQFMLRVLIIAALGSSSNLIAWAGEKDIAVEGIVYESRDPSRSFAIIDGNDYQKGSQYQGHEIVEILQDRVRVKKANGTISELRIMGSVAVRPYSKTKQADGSGKTDSGDPTENIWEQFKNKFGIDALSLLNYVVEISVKADMRNLYMQVNVAAMESDGRKALSLDQMIQDGMVNPAFNEAKNGYKYRIATANGGIEVFADPVNGAEKSNHFMIDSWGNMRVELGRPATSKSPLVKLPAGLEGLIPKQPQRSTSPEEMFNSEHLPSTGAGA